MVLKINGDVKNGVFTVSGVRISNGSAKIPVYYITENGLDTNWAYIIEGEFELVSSTIYINSSEVMNYYYSFSMENTIASGYMEYGRYFMANSNVNIHNTEFSIWKDY